MRTVRQWLDELAAGTVTLAEVAADFATRRWPDRPLSTAAQQWGAADDTPAEPDSWDAVNADSRLTAAQYQVLAEARNRAGRRSPSGVEAALTPSAKAYTESGREGGENGNEPRVPGAPGGRGG